MIDDVMGELRRMKKHKGIRIAFTMDRGFGVLKLTFKHGQTLFFDNGACFLKTFRIKKNLDSWTKNLGVGYTPIEYEGDCFLVLDGRGRVLMSRDGPAMFVARSLSARVGESRRVATLCANRC